MPPFATPRRRHCYAAASLSPFRHLRMLFSPCHFFFYMSPDFFARAIHVISPRFIERRLLLIATLTIIAVTPLIFTFFFFL